MVQWLRKRDRKNSEFFILYHISYPLYPLFCTLYFVFCIMYSTLCFLYSVLCVLFSVSCTLYFVFCILWKLGDNYLCKPSISSPEAILPSVRCEFPLTRRKIQKLHLLNPSVKYSAIGIQYFLHELVQYSSGHNLHALNLRQSCIFSGLGL